METVLITGATSGIGLTTANLLVEKRYQVFGTSRKPELHQEKVKYPLLPLDITNNKSVETCISLLLEQTDSIDVLVNNAGMMVCGSTEETPIELAKAQFETNFWGAVTMTRAVLPAMRKQKKGKIITIGSLAGIIGVPFESYYSASKHAIEGFYKSLRLELRSLNIIVSVVEPGFFKSNLYESAKFATSFIKEYDGIREAALKEIEDSCNQAPAPDGVAETVLKIIKNEHPKFSYKVGGEAKILPVLQFLSSRIFEWGAAKKFKV